MNRTQAVVVGAGIAGLAAAKVLSRHFEQVVIVDADPAVGSAEPRKGAKQGAHLHVLLSRGQELLFRFFPGLINNSKILSCPVLDWALDTHWETSAGVYPKYPSEVKTRLFSRPLLESLMVQDLLRLPNVGIESAKLDAIECAAGQITRICLSNGLTYRPQICVLAAGHKFKIRELMMDLDFDRHTVRHPIQITYRSTRHKTAAIELEGVQQYYYQYDPGSEYAGAVISPIENQLSVATVISNGRLRRIPTAFLEFTKAKENQTVETIFHKPEMALRRFDRVIGFPHNCYVLGDLFCSLNPAYGQGMTVAFEQARLLDEELASLRPDAHRFHQKSAKLASLPFFLSKLGSQAGDGFLDLYLQNFIKAAQADIALHRKFLRVLHMRDGLAQLFSVRVCAHTAYQYVEHQLFGRLRLLKRKFRSA